MEVGDKMKASVVMKEACYERLTQGLSMGRRPREPACREKYLGLVTDPT